jgi:hypothetical protein
MKSDLERRVIVEARNPFFRPVAAPVLATLLVLTACAARSVADDDLDPELAIVQWETDVGEQIAKDDKLKALAAKHTVGVVLSARLHGRRNNYSAYSFTHRTNDGTMCKGEVQLCFDNGRPKTVDVRGGLRDRFFIVDLGKADFTKGPDLKQITIEDKRVQSHWAEMTAKHVYLERINDGCGNDFFVLFEVITLDADSRYLAFIWRKLPGGTTAKEKK